MTEAESTRLDAFNAQRERTASNGTYQDDMERRVVLYNESDCAKQWPKSRLRWDGSMAEGVWRTGQDYRNRTKLYGAYPPNYLRRVMSIFPDVKPADTLHLFAGSVPAGSGLRFDINPKLSPDRVGDAEKLSEYFGLNKFDLILADPPYSAEDARRYGTKMVNQTKVVSECAKVLRPGGYLCYLSTIWPMHRKNEMLTVGMVFIVRSTMHRVRMMTIFQKVGQPTKGQRRLQ